MSSHSPTRVQRTRTDDANAYLLHNASFLLRRYDNRPQRFVTVVRRVADAQVEPRAVVQHSPRICVRAESPLAVVFTHSGISDAAEWQLMDDWLQGAVVDRRISGGR